MIIKHYKQAHKPEKKNVINKRNHRGNKTIPTTDCGNMVDYQQQQQQQSSSSTHTTYQKHNISKQPPPPPSTTTNLE
ncbi:hypothetical protein DERF_000690 [Dermatophagoides farinae]|uniref:Uncharacterized protein n=1 Tax=Dermatophagoides farinae TaxID=6954 RepID=A0A922IC36_DERFA|nr:hypothetical protein DERF_000690 [Dermatophagoides farinae]